MRWLWLEAEGRCRLPPVRGRSNHLSAILESKKKQKPMHRDPKKCHISPFSLFTLLYRLRLYYLMLTDLVYSLFA